MSQAVEGEGRCRKWARTAERVARVSWPILKRTYEQAAAWTGGALLGLVLANTMLDPDFREILNNYMADTLALSHILAGAAGAAGGLIADALAALPAFVRFIALSLLASFAYYGSVKILRAIGHGDA